MEIQEQPMPRLKTMLVTEDHQTAEHHGCRRDEAAWTITLSPVRDCRSQQRNHECRRGCPDDAYGNIQKQPHKRHTWKIGGTEPQSPGGGHQHELHGNGQPEYQIDTVHYNSQPVLDIVDAF